MLSIDRDIVRSNTKYWNTLYAVGQSTTITTRMASSTQTHICDDDLMTEAGEAPMKSREEQWNSSNDSSGTGRIPKRFIIRLFFMYTAVIIVGSLHNMYGVILLELGKQTGAHFQQLAMLFTWNFAGRLSATICLNRVFDRLNVEMQFGVICLMTMIWIVPMSLTHSYYLLAVSVYMLGVCSGYTTSGTTCSVFVWCNEISIAPGPFLQLVYFTFSIGSLMSPILVKNFLGKAEDFPSVQNQSYEFNMTQELPNIDSFRPAVFIPLMIICGCMIIPAIAFWAQFTLDKCQPRREIGVQVSKFGDTGTESLLVVLHSFGLFLAAGTEVTFTGLLFTYLVELQAWIENDAATLISVFWAVMLVCRAMCIVVVRYLSPAAFGSINFILFVVGFALILTLSHLSRVVLWVGSMCVAMGCAGHITPWFMTANTVFTMSGSLTALLQASCYMGAMTIPSICGYISLRFVPHLLLGMSLLLLAIHVLTQMLAARTVLRTQNIEESQRLAEEEAFQESQPHINMQELRGRTFSKLLGESFTDSLSSIPL